MNKLYILLFLFGFYFGFAQSLDMKWIKSFTSPGAELNPEYSAPLPNEGLVVAGWQQRSSNPWSCLFVLAIDSSGNEMWRDSIECISSNDFYIRGMTATPSGEVVVTGEFQGSLRCSGFTVTDSLYGGYSTFLARFNNGALSSFSTVQGASAIQLNSDSQGNIFIAMETYGTAYGFGNTWSAIGQHDIIVCKISPANMLLWSKQFSGRVNTTLLVVNPADETILFGSFFDTLRFDASYYTGMNFGPYGCDLFMANLSSSGNVSQLSISPSGILMPTQAIFNNDKIIITSPVCGNHGCGVAYQEIDSTSSSVWYKGFPQSPLGYADNYNMAHIASIDPTGFWAFGQVSVGMVGFSSGTHYHIFTHFDFNGNETKKDSFLIPNNSLTYGKSLTASSGSSMYVVGMFKDSLRLYGNQVTDAGSQMFMSRLTAANVVTSVNEHTYDVFQIYPNPTNGIFTISGTPQKNSSVCVYDVFGNCVLKKTPLSNTNQSIDLSKFAKGVYFVELSTDKRTMQKIILE